jgi:CHAT domain-containing protein
MAILAEPNDGSVYRTILDCASRENGFPAAIDVLSEIASVQPQNPTIRHTLAYCYRETGQAGKAKEQWQRAIEIDPTLEGATVELARLHVIESDYESAAKVLAGFVTAKKGLSHLSQPVTIKLMMEVLHGAASALVATDRPIKDDIGRVLRILMGEIYATLSRMQSVAVIQPQKPQYRALKPPPASILIPAAKFNRLVNNSAVVAGLYQVYGMQAGQHNDVETHELYLREALSLLGPRQDPVTYFGIAGNLAKVYDREGKYREAEELFTRILAEHEALLRENYDAQTREVFSVILAKNFYNYSQLLWKRGDVLSSLSNLYRAEGYYLKRQAKPGEMMAFNDYLNLYDEMIDRYLKLNNSEQAKAVMRREEGVFRLNQEVVFLAPNFKLRAKAQEMKINLHDGDLESAGANLADISAAVNSASEFVRQQFDTYQMLEVKFLELRLLEARGEHEELFRKYLTVMREVIALENERQVYLRRYRVETMLMAIRALMAQKKFYDLEKVFGILESQLGEADPYNWKSDSLHLKARYYELTGNDQKADAAYREMVRYLSGLRGMMPIADDLYQSEQRLVDAYSSYVRFLVRRKRFADGLEIFERAKTQTLLRSLQLRSATQEDANAPGGEGLYRFQRLAWERFALTKEFSDDTRARRDALERRLEEVTSAYKAAFQQVSQKLRLPSQDASLPELLRAVRGVEGYVVIIRTDSADSTITTWWVKDGQIISAETRTVEWERLSARLKVFADLAASGAAASGGLTYSSLAETLLADVLPGAALLPDDSKLTIIPDAQLQELPFAALRIAGEPLVLKKVGALAYAPSLTALAHLQQSFAGPAKDSGLFIGYRGGAGNFVDLKYTEADAREMHGAFRNAGREAKALTPPESLSKENVKGNVSGQGVVVIGTHGMLDTANPMNAFVQLEGADRVRAFDLFDWRFDGSRVILSACQVGKDVAAHNQDILGMTFPLFSAGARSVLHAQWSVEQTATSELMREVIAALVAGKSLDAALVTAQRRYYQDAGVALMRHPKYWAAWRVVGKGQ